ncbi:hypothetical protein STXM2123_3347 [Streptomyces sp. F-3]|nr:hypothetical protein STXM2123_3347 [Streptomyces sp. F-3]
MYTHIPSGAPRPGQQDRKQSPYFAAVRHDEAPAGDHRQGLSAAWT